MSKLTHTHDEHWSDQEVTIFNTATITFASAVVILPFIIPRGIVHAWPAAITLYDRLGVAFPYLSRSLPLASDTDFYIVSKLVLFGLGALFVLACSLFPLNKHLDVLNYRMIEQIRRLLSWFWLPFAVLGYGIFFWMYSQTNNLSWASKAAVSSLLGIALGNLAQFSVFVLLAIYLLLVKHYFRLRSAWEIEHGKERSKSV